MLAALSLAGCAFGRSVVEVKPTASTVGTATPGTAPVKIVAVADERVFEVDPRSPSTPSLKDSTQITDPQITARAIGRKRNGFGAALGDVVLPEGNTVAGLVRGAAQRALQEKGYRVVDEGSPDYGGALPLSIAIQQFWGWFTPGLVSVTVECKSAVTLKGDALVGADLPPVNAYVRYDSAAIFESTWADIARRCVDDLSVKMKEKLAAP